MKNPLEYFMQKPDKDFQEYFMNIDNVYRLVFSIKLTFNISIIQKNI